MVAIYLFELLKESAVVEKLKTREKQKKDSTLAHFVKGVNGLILWVGMALIRFAQRDTKSNEKPPGNASDKLRILNENQIAMGATKLKIELERLRAAGIIDRQGKRTSAELPAEMKNGNSEVV